MGSTFPLLEMEDTRFSRTGVTAEILATGWRPLRRTRAKATIAAKTRKITMRFRSLRSIASYSDCAAGLLKPDIAGTRARRRSHCICAACWPPPGVRPDRKSTRLNSSHSSISYAVFCLKKKKKKITTEKIKKKKKKKKINV